MSEKTTTQRDPRKGLLLKGALLLAALGTAAGTAYAMTGHSGRSSAARRAAKAEPAGLVRAGGIGFQPGEFTGLLPPCRTADPTSAECIGGTKTGAEQGPQTPLRATCLWTMPGHRSATMVTELFQPDPAHWLRATTLAVQSFRDHRDRMPGAKAVPGVGEEAAMLNDHGDVHFVARRGNVLLTLEYQRNNDGYLSDWWSESESVKISKSVLDRLEPI